MAEMKENASKTKKSNKTVNNKATNKQIDEETKHDITITLMVGVLIVLSASAAILFACSYYLEHLNI